MTNAEFLDDVERRAINGDVFTSKERNRLWELSGYTDALTTTEIDTYLKNSARRLVRVARKHLIALVTERIKEAV